MLMYSTCLFCNRPLGRNEAIETFPVGRRLAFDPSKGRLWVVCRRCERWNLSPLEVRWEAIEECERRFRDTRLRTSTDNIGLAAAIADDLLLPDSVREFIHRERRTAEPEAPWGSRGQDGLPPSARF